MTAPALALALALLAAGALGCGRLGYDVQVNATDGSDEDAGEARDARRPDDPTADGSGLETGPLPDGGAGDTEPGRDGPAADVAIPSDTGGPVDTALPLDAAVTTDTVPGADVGPVSGTCMRPPATDIIADFEDGTLNLNKVGARGGPPFRLVNPALGGVSNTATTFCGQRALELESTSTSPQSPLIQGHLMTNDANNGPRFYDAGAYRGITVALRASTPTVVRLKISNFDTFYGGNDNFQIVLSVGTVWGQWLMDWRALKQQGAPGATQFPTFNVDRLYAVEISATLPLGETVWADNFAFLR